MNPIYLIVFFANGDEPVNRTYFRATEAVDNMSKAIEYYTARAENCRLELYDYRGVLIITQTVGTMPDEKEESTHESAFQNRHIDRDQLNKTFRSGSQ